MRYIHSYITFGCLAISGLCSDLSGQDDDSDTLWLRPIVIQSQQLSEVYSVDSIPVLQIQEASSLVEALRGSGNYYVREYGVGNIANVSMRGGSAQHTALYWNGLPINSPSLGITDLSLIPTIFIDEVRVHAGASSLLTGAGGLSGSMLLQSGKRAKGNNLMFRQSMSPTLAEFNTDIALNLQDGRWRSRTGLHSQEADNAFEYLDDSGPNDVWKKRENATTRTRGLSQDLSYELDHRHSILLSTYYIDADREIPANIGLPASEDRQEDRIGRAALRVERSTSRWRHSLLIGESEEWQRFTSPQAMIESVVRTSAGHAQFVTSHSLSDRTLIRGRLSHDRFKLLMADQEGRTSVHSGLFAEIDHATINDLKINIGARVEHVDGNWTPMKISMGLSQKVSSIQGLTMKASGSMNYRDPTLNDLYWPILGNPELNSESGISTDFGVQFEQKGYFLSLGCFYNELDDLISWLPASDGQFRPVNVSESQNRGLESQVRVYPFSWLIVKGSYSYTDNQVRRKEGEQFQQNIYQPVHRAFGNLMTTWGQHSFEVVYSFNSEVRTDYLTSSNDLPAINALNLVYRNSPKKLSGVTIGFELHNLLNHNYQYVAQRPTAGRYLQFKLIVNINEKS